MQRTVECNYLCSTMTFHGVFTVAPGDVKIMNVTLLVGKSESQLNVSLMKVTKAAHVDRHYE